MMSFLHDKVKNRTNCVGVMLPTPCGHRRIGDLSAPLSTPLPPRLVGNLLHRREEILEDRASAEVNLGVDLDFENEQ
jgi:hypothetical protein